MTTAAALNELEAGTESAFENANPHWSIGRDGDGTFWCDYTYCGDPDCDCYQRDEGQTREELLERFENDMWIPIRT